MVGDSKTVSSFSNKIWCCARFCDDPGSVLRSLVFIFWCWSHKMIKYFPILSDRHDSVVCGCIFHSSRFMRCARADTISVWTPYSQRRTKWIFALHLFLLVACNLSFCWNIFYYHSFSLHWNRRWYVLTSRRAKRPASVRQDRLLKQPVGYHQFAVVLNFSQHQKQQQEHVWRRQPRVSAMAHCTLRVDRTHGFYQSASTLPWQ